MWKEGKEGKEADIGKERERTDGRKGVNIGKKLKKKINSYLIQSIICVFFIVF